MEGRLVVNYFLQVQVVYESPILVSNSGGGYEFTSIINHTVQGFLRNWAGSKKRYNHRKVAGDSKTLFRGIFGHNK